jgi:hypothetical protein
MTTIFLRELRESLKWAAVICAVLCFLFYNKMVGANPLMLFALPPSSTIFLAPLAGLLMGVMQSLFETRPDNWAFAVNRPVPRLAIFVAKCAAGLCLLYAALALPLAGATAWVARPGNLPMPFQWRMVLPLLADALLAGCFYFAGIVLTLRRARWLGTRLLPFGLALACLGVVTDLTPEFWQAVLIMLAVQCVGAVAAWGVFATGGAADAGGAPAIALGAMIYPGALAAGVILIGMSNLLPATGRWQQYLLDRDGNPLRVTWSRGPDGERNSVISDAAGNPLPRYAGVDVNDPANADLFVRGGGALYDDRSVPWPVGVLYLGEGYRAPTAGLVRLRTVAPVGVRVRWACVYNVQRRVIELYDPVTKALEGSVGPAGFARGRTAPAEVFPGMPLNPRHQDGTHTLAFPSAVYWMELDQHRVRSVFTAEVGDPVVSAVELNARGTPEVMVLTRSRVHRLRSTGEVVFSVPVPHDPPRHYYEPVVLPASGNLVLFGGAGPEDESFQGEYIEYGTDGRIVRRTELPPRPDLGGPKVTQTALLGLIYPPAALVVVPEWMLREVFDMQARGYSWLFHRCVAIGTLLAMGVTLLLARRCGFGATKTALWMAAALLLGPAAIVMMVGLNEWPAREACIACGGRRFVGRRHCPGCRAAPPAPAFDGREIFEPADAVQPAF